MAIAEVHKNRRPQDPGNADHLAASGSLRPPWPATWRGGRAPVSARPRMEHLRQRCSSGALRQALLRQALAAEELVDVVDCPGA